MNPLETTLMVVLVVLVLVVAACVVALARAKAKRRVTGGGDHQGGAKTAAQLLLSIRARGLELWAQPEKQDGLKAWQPFKPAYDAVGGVSEWVPVSDEGRAILESLEAIEGGATESKLSKEQAHFFAQLLRIPAREKCTFRKLAQVFFNAGQFEGSGSYAIVKKEYPAWARYLEANPPSALSTYCADLGAFAPTGGASWAGVAELAKAALAESRVAARPGRAE